MKFRTFEPVIAFPPDANINTKFYDMSGGNPDVCQPYCIGYACEVKVLDFLRNDKALSEKYSSLCLMCSLKIRFR